jgi:Spy/CpxP family protein refolding chaperone
MVPRKFCAGDGSRLSSDCAVRPSFCPETARFGVGMLIALPRFTTDGQHVCVVPQRSKKTNNIPNARGEYPMKVNQLLTICGIAAALVLSAGNVSAQNDNGGGGGRRFGGGNFDPAQMQQRMMDNIKEQFGYTNDTEWNAVQPLFQKVVDARRDVGFGGGMGRLFRNRNRNNGDQAGGNGGGGRGGMFGQPSPEAEALQKAIDDNAPTSQIKDLFAKYKTSQKAKQTKLVQAQENLRKVLTPKQEAQATLLGLLE